jgi:hypothetical protein
MRNIATSIAAIAILLVMAAGCAGGPKAKASGEETIPLKEAKLNIEHNATDSGTDFQGFLDSEGWSRMEVTGFPIMCGTCPRP